MPTTEYLTRLVEKTKPYLPQWLFRELHHHARGYAGGKLRSRSVKKLYESTDDLPAAVKKLPAKKRRQWMKAFNSAYYNAPAGRDKEEYAFRVAWAVVKKEEVEPEFHIVKADDEQQLLYGVVYVPDEEDAQEDLANAAEIQKGAHGFLAMYGQGLAYIDEGHDDKRTDAEVVESFIAPWDFTYEGSEEEVKKGSWVLVTHILSKKTWERVKKEYTGYSLAGTGKRVKVT